MVTGLYTIVHYFTLVSKVNAINLNFTSEEVAQSPF